MHNWHKAVGLMAVGLLALPSPARADRIPSRKVQIEAQPGVKPQIAVPYTTNGSGNLGVYQGVSPKIYKSPTVDDPTNPQAKPVFNIPFWGAVQAFGDRSNGVTPRYPGPPFPR